MPENIHEIVSDLIVDTKGSAESSFFAITKDSSFYAFLPELIVCATIVLMLLVRVIKGGRRVDTFWLMFGGSLIALWFAAPWQHLGATPDLLDPSTASRMEIFTGMLVYDTFGVYIRSVLLLFAVLFAVFTKLSGVPDREDSPDIYALVLGSTLGMCLMASANHLIMVFMAVEMASVPSFVLAGLQKGNKLGSEAALKYAVFGAGAAGVMLYGISLVAGLLNTAHLPTMAAQLAEKLPEMASGELTVLMLGGLMITVGLAFKLTAVPFHFWCPDVFEGATAEVNAFLSIASKTAALALLLRVAVGFGTIPPSSTNFDDLVVEDGTIHAPADAKYFAPGVRTVLAAARAKEGDARIGDAIAMGARVDPPTVLMSVADEPTKADAKKDAAKAQPESPMAALAPSRDFIAKLIALLAIITCTFGNLAAYGQTNIKRLMAYSTIAHAGYMMLPIPAILAVAGHSSAAAEGAVQGLCIYIAIYMFMNLGVFAIIAYLRNAMGSEEISDYAGLIRRSPIIAICFVIILFSLVGLPPLAGFIGKFAIFASLVECYQVTADAGNAATYLMVLLVVGGINTVISLFYYLRVAKVITMESGEDSPPVSFSSASREGFFVMLATAPTLILFLSWDQLKVYAEAAARHLFL